MTEIQRLLTATIDDLNIREKRDNRPRFSISFIRKHPGLFVAMRPQSQPARALRYLCELTAQADTCRFRDVRGDLYLHICMQHTTTVNPPDLTAQEQCFAAIFPDMFRVVDHTGNGLIRNPRKEGYIIKSDRFHAF
jgi:Extracytoplasmic function sigma factor YlaC.